MEKNNTKALSISSQPSVSANEIDKAYGFAKGEQLEEKVNNYRETYENIKKVSFQEIDNMIIVPSSIWCSDKLLFFLVC